MPVEIQMLVCSVALYLLMIAVQGTAGVMQMGVTKALGNRDDVPPATGFAARAKRNVSNFIESLTLFAPLALATVVTHEADKQSALGSTIYLYARIAYSLCYLVGIPYLRTLCWAAGIAGTILVGFSLFS